jgi:hypothetical protein
MQGKPKERSPSNNPSLRLEADGDWKRLLAWLPDGLDELALSCHAIVRRRVVTSGTMLLRLVLLYAVCCFSLRDAAAWAARSLRIELTADALAYRFARAVPLLKKLVGLLLQQLTDQGAAGMRLRILDATTFTEPGSAEVNWRLHLTFSPSPCRTVGAELTDGKGGEHLWRSVCSAGDLVIGDRGVGHASDVRTAKEREAHCLLRVDVRHLVLTDPQGRRLSPTRLLQDARQGRLDHAALLHERGHEPVSVRVVMMPMPKEKAARARQRLRKTRKRKTGRAPRALTLRLAGYLCCVTTLSVEQAPVTVLASWYGVRWQVELVFKRCKSLLHLDHLTKGREALVAVQIWARLLVALVVERLVARSAAARTAAFQVSLWRLTHIHWVDVVLAIYGGASLDDRLAAGDLTIEGLRERPRRRCSGVDRLVREIADVLGPAGGPAPAG